jgi:hypothetical protein
MNTLRDVGTSLRENRRYYRSGNGKIEAEELFSFFCEALQ